MTPEQAALRAPGPYYSDESVTLWHGDCREVLPLIDPVDLVLTDPPYGINYVSNHNVGRGTQPITNDDYQLLGASELGERAA